MLVPRQSEYPRTPGPLPYHMQHANHSGMPGNSNFSSYSSQHPPGGPGNNKYICIFYFGIEIGPLHIA